MKLRKITQEDISKIIELYNSGTSIRKIESHVPIKRTRIQSILNKANVKMKSVGNAYRLRKYHFDEGYFEKIDTEEKAYWLGFIAADGHVSNDGLVICLAIKDSKHLNKFKDSLKGDFKVKENLLVKIVTVSLYSYKLRDSLRSFGFYRNKSYSLRFPNISEKLINHFIRGYFDGDGCIGISKNQYKKGKNPSYAISIGGTSMFIEDLKRIMMLACNASNTKLQHMKNGFCVVQWGGNKKVESILDWIYNDATIYLDRKYNRYLELKNDNSRNGPQTPSFEPGV